MGEGRRERWVEAGGPAGAVARGSGGEHAEAVRAQPDGGAPCAVEEAGRAQRLTATRRQLWPAAATLEDGCPGRAALVLLELRRPGRCFLAGLSSVQLGMGVRVVRWFAVFQTHFFIASILPSPTVVAAAAASAACVACWQQRLSSMISLSGLAQLSFPEYRRRCQPVGAQKCV